MSEKQDRQGARTPADLERKWQFGKRFAEIMGIALDAQNSITEVDSELRHQIEEQYTKIMRDTEKIILEASAKYVQTSDYEEYQRTVSAQFKIMADEISANLKSTTDWMAEVSNEIGSVDDDLQGTKDTIESLSKDLDNYSTASEEFKQAVTEELTKATEDLEGVHDDLELHYKANSEFQEYCENELSATSKQITLNMESTTESFTEVHATLENTQGDILAEHQFTEELKEYCESEFAATAQNLELKFQSSTEQITNINGDVQKISENLQKHFEFSTDGLTIKAGESEMKLRIDNDLIAFYKGDIDENDLTKNRFGWWDGTNFHTGNVVVTVEERAQFGDFAFIPRSNGSLDFLKVGGSQWPSTEVPL